MASKFDTASKFALFSVSGLKDEKLTRKQTCMKTETWKLYSSLLNISAKCYQNRYLKLLAIPFQSWCIFSETQWVYIL